MESLALVEGRLREVDRRLDATHDSIGALRGSQGKHEVEIAVMHKEISGISEDIGDLRHTIENQIALIRRGLWAAAATFAGLILTLAGLIVNLST